MNLGVEKQKSSRTVAREAFFLEFATSIRADFPEIPLIVTGGFRSRQGMEAAVAEGHCDLVGLGRPAVLDPFLPRDVILNPKVDDADARFTAKKIEPSWLLKKVGIRAIGAGVESVSVQQTCDCERAFILTKRADMVQRPNQEARRQATESTMMRKGEGQSECT